MQFPNETEQKTLSKIVEKFDEFAIGEVNGTYERTSLTDKIRDKMNL